MSKLNLHLFNIRFLPFFFGVLVISSAVATVSYFVVERPALRLKDSLGWFRGRLNSTINATVNPNDPSS